MNFKRIILLVTMVMISNFCYLKIHPTTTNIKDTALQSSLIIRGKVEKIQPFNDGMLAQVQVERTLKGQSSNVIEVFFYSPEQDEPKTSLDAEKRILKFETGEEVLLFLKPGEEKYFRVVNLDYGKLSISQSAEGEVVSVKHWYQKNDNFKSVESLQHIISYLGDTLKIQTIRKIDGS